MPWDHGFYDDGAWDSDSKPKRKKTMKRPSWFPSGRADQVLLLNNLHKVSTYAATLPLAAPGLAAFLLDVDNAIYALEAYRVGADSFNKAVYPCIENVLNGDSATDIVWLTFAAPAGTPDPVHYGCLQRVFTYVEETIKKAPGCTPEIRADLKIDPPATPATTATIPEFTLRTLANGKMEVVWPKGGNDGVKLQFKLGGGVTQDDIDLRPNYTLNWLPPAGTSAIIQVRLMYILKGNDTGAWSDWQQWTLTGV